MLAAQVADLVAFLAVAGLVHVLAAQHGVDASVASFESNEAARSVYGSWGLAGVAGMKLAGASLAATAVHLGQRRMPLLATGVTLAAVGFGVWGALSGLNLLVELRAYLLPMP